MLRARWTRSIERRVDPRGAEHVPFAIDRLDDAIGEKDGAIAVVERDRLLGIDFVRLDAEGQPLGTVESHDHAIVAQQARRVMPGAGVSQRSLDGSKTA